MENNKIEDNSLKRLIKTHWPLARLAKKKERYKLINDQHWEWKSSEHHSYYKY